MNELGVMLVWCALQVTLIVALALGLSYLLSRWSLRVSRTVVSMGSVLVLFLTVLAWSPWPRWSWLAVSPSSASPASGAESMSHTSTPDESKVLERAVPQKNERLATQSHPSTWQSFAQAFSEEMRQVPGRGQHGWSWQAYIALLFLSLALYGAVHLLFGAVAVHRLRGRARPLQNPAILELVNELRARMKLRAQVEVLESDELAIAATIGWRRPAILLSPDWKRWTPLELRLVVAHELAHIRGHDFLCFVCAKAGLALHLYHPLVHWLVRRLQLDLELAADASAAAIAENPAHYLRTLADMALRQSDRRLGWSARTFLPTHGTFMRRLEMLKNTPSLRWQPAAGLRVLAGGLLLTAGLIVAGMRGAVGADPPANQAGAKTGGTTMNSSDWVPADAMAVFMYRPADLAAQKNVAEMARLPSAEVLTRFGLAPENVEQLTALLSRSEEKDVRLRRGGIIVHLKVPGKVDPPLPKEAKVSTKEFMGKTYTTTDDVAWAQVTPQTILIAAEDDLKAMIVNGPATKSPLFKSKHWPAVAAQPIVVAVDMSAVSRALDLADAPPSIQAMFTPLWSDVAELYLACGFDGALKLEGMIQGREGSSLQKTKDTLTAAQTLAKNMISGVRQQWSREPAADRALLVTVLDIADELLKSTRVEDQAGNSLSVKATATIDAQRWASLQQSVLMVRQSAQRAQSMNNMKQLALAMFSYESVHGHFPPAVIMGKDNKGGVPHSWRVEMLPYVEAQNLYNAYKFDEPWDSENNKKVLAQMPAVFRSPEDQPDSTNASYFAAVGPDTVFSKPEGMKLLQITDGTSNTIALLEAKLDVPWTKPVDIEISPDKPLPKLGGWRGPGYAAAFCDGSVRFFAKGIEEKRLRTLLSIAGGEPVQLNEFDD